MAKITLEHQEEILTFPVDTILELKIQEVSIETIQSERGDWQKARFKFKILGIQALGDGGDPGPYESWITRDIWGSVPWRLTDSPENKLRIWAEAIFRRELGEGFELDSDMFLQRSVRGLTSQYDAKSRDSEGNPFKRHQIETLLPWSDGSPAQPVAASAPVGGWVQPQGQNQTTWGNASASAGDPWALPTGSDEPPF